MGWNTRSPSGWQLGLSWVGLSEPCVMLTPFANIASSLLGTSTYADGNFVTWYTPFGSSTVAIAYSPDGVNWTTVNPSDNLGAHSLIYAGGLFVGGENNFGRIRTSPDGINWTNRRTLTASEGVPTTSVGWSGGGYIVGVNNNLTTNADVYTSPTGVTWTGTYFGVPDNLRETTVSALNGYMYALMRVQVGAGLGPYYLRYSTNHGTSWSPLTSPSTSFNSQYNGWDFADIKVLGSEVLYWSAASDDTDKLWSAPLGSSSWTQHTVPNDQFSTVDVSFDGIRYWIVQTEAFSADPPLSHLSYSEDRISWTTVHSWQRAFAVDRAPTNGSKLIIPATVFPASEWSLNSLDIPCAVGSI